MTFGNATAYTLLLAPAERADIIVDFTDVPFGSTLILYSDSPSPFPGGDPRNDYYTGDPDFSVTGLNQGGAPHHHLSARVPTPGPCCSFG